MPLDFTAIDTALTTLKLEAQAAADAQTAKAASDAQAAALSNELAATKADLDDAEAKVAEIGGQLQDMIGILAAARAPAPVAPASIDAVAAAVVT